jgi:hypothetical protein
MHMTQLINLIDARHTRQELYEEVKNIISVGAFLMDEVQLAPWAITRYYQVRPLVG